MPASIASCVFGLFIIWVFWKDARARKNVSVALWIPLAWACIIGSKPVSFWLDPNRYLGSTEYLEDKLLDKGVFIVLFTSGLLILARRRLTSRIVIQSNRWLGVFFLYLALSVLWSDEPFVSFKRWIKDFGNIIMVLVVLSEEDPQEGIRAFLAWCTYLLIPLTVLVVKYYPRVGTEYSRWTGEPVCVGITTNKNSLGMTLFVCIVSLFWMLLDSREIAVREKDRGAPFRYSLLIIMTVWLLVKARSATAVTCTLIGGCILLGMRISAIRNKMRWLVFYAAGVVVLALVLQASGLWDVVVGAFAEAVGRDPSFHGRHAIWGAVLKEDINPIFGVGYYSFWSPERMERLSKGYFYLLNEAHNGFLETYLNSGLIGLCLLISMLVSALNRIKKEVLTGASYGGLRLSFLVAAVLYAVSEAIFNRLSLMWLVLLLVIMERPGRVKTEPDAGQDSALGRRERALLDSTNEGSSLA